MLSTAKHTETCGWRFLKARDYRSTNAKWTACCDTVLALVWSTNINMPDRSNLSPPPCFFVSGVVLMEISEVHRKAHYELEENVSIVYATLLSFLLLSWRLLRSLCAITASVLNLELWHTELLLKHQQFTGWKHKEGAHTHHTNKPTGVRDMTGLNMPTESTSWSWYHVYSLQQKKKKGKKARKIKSTVNRCKLRMQYTVFEFW